MTSGQRSCYEAIEHCLDCYGWGDVLFAVNALQDKQESEEESDYYERYDLTHACGHAGHVYSPPQLREKFVRHEEAVCCSLCKSLYRESLTPETDS